MHFIESWDVSNIFIEGAYLIYLDVLHPSSYDVLLILCFLYLSAGSREIKVLDDLNSLSIELIVFEGLLGFVGFLQELG